MACRLVGAKPLSEPMVEYCQLGPKEQTSVKSEAKFTHFHSRKCIWKHRLRNGGHFVSASMCSNNSACSELKYINLQWVYIGCYCIRQSQWFSHQLSNFSLSAVRLFLNIFQAKWKIIYITISMYAIITISISSRSCPLPIYNLLPLLLLAALSKYTSQCRILSAEISPSPAPKGMSGPQLCKYIMEMARKQLCAVVTNTWWLWHQKQVCIAWICNCMPQNTVQDYYLSMPHDVLLLHGLVSRSKLAVLKMKFMIAVKSACHLVTVKPLI